MGFRRRGKPPPTTGAKNPLAIVSAVGPAKSRESVKPANHNGLPALSGSGATGTVKSPWQQRLHPTGRLGGLPHASTATGQANFPQRPHGPTCRASGERRVQSDNHLETRGMGSFDSRNRQAVGKHLICLESRRSLAWKLYACNDSIH